MRRLRFHLRVAVLFPLMVPTIPASSQSANTRPQVTISGIMIDPATVSDDHGEWLELRNDDPRPVSIAGWRLTSGRDPGFTIPAGTTIPAQAAIILARDPNHSTNGRVHATLGYSGLAFGNRADWLALHNARGGLQDSVAWQSSVRGEVFRPHRTLPPIIPSRTQNPHIIQPPSGQDSVISAASPRPAASELVVRMLDIGQGDAILIQNGGSTVLVDGGPNPAALGAHLDALGLNGGTIDAVILSHAHADHYQGLRELFSSRRRIAVRFFWESQDPSPNATLARLRDSIGARVAAGTLVYRDTDDPCANGQPTCVITLKGGARLEILRPDPQAHDPNNRSPALKLLGPDSASFSMWMAGDAEAEAIDFFERTGYAQAPGMKVDVLKADHHGSCNGVSDHYLDLLHPSLVVVSVGAINDYGHMHEQAKTTFARHGLPWYRTDQNGTITLRSPGIPGGGYQVFVERGTKNMSGPSDRRSTQAACSRM